MKQKAVCILSGGMDSALSSYIAKAKGFEIVALHFNYGQRTQQKELEAYRKLQKSLDAVESYEIDLDFFKRIGASSLVDHSMEVPTGGLEEGVPSTYVPFRNGIFLSIATAIAEKEGATDLFIGVVAEDSSGYPDCTAEYIRAQQQASNLGTKDETKLTINMPLVAMSKAQIVTEATRYGVPLQHTWSCYQDSDQACGVCDSCRLRLRGFEKAGLIDPIEYRKA